jgi:GxxExxY protein
VIGHVFRIHREFGRFFEERIYKRELASRLPEVELEFPITVSHGTFATIYYLDVLVARCAPFEFKAVDLLTPHHRGQLYNYLLLLDLAHGKLVNTRPESVEHEFVNAICRATDRRAFEVVSDCWDGSVPGSGIVYETICDLCRDWGTGLELPLYESALVHFLGGEERVDRRVVVRGSVQIVGDQALRFAADGVAFRLTAFDSDCRFEQHARCLLEHVDLRAILWVNITVPRVTFTTIDRRL